VFSDLTTDKQEVVYRFLEDDGAFATPQESFELEN